MSGIKIWALSLYGHPEVTVCAPTALDALRYAQQRTAEGDAVAATVTDPDRVELIVAVDVS